MSAVIAYLNVLKRIIKDNKSFCMVGPANKFSFKLSPSVGLEEPSKTILSLVVVLDSFVTPECG